MHYGIFWWGLFDVPWSLKNAAVLVKCMDLDNHAWIGAFLGLFCVGFGIWTCKVLIGEYHVWIHSCSSSCNIFLFQERLQRYYRCDAGMLQKYCRFKYLHLLINTFWRFMFTLFGLVNWIWICYRWLRSRLGGRHQALKK